MRKKNTELVDTFLSYRVDGNIRWDGSEASWTEAIRQITEQLYNAVAVQVGKEKVVHYKLRGWKHTDYSGRVVLQARIHDSGCCDGAISLEAKCPKHTEGTEKGVRD